MRTMRARKVRADLGRPTVEANGALGISKEMLADGFKDRRTAISAPPALMLSAVENSRNSLPSGFFPRTKTGMAKGKRCHLRRSLPSAANRDLSNRDSSLIPHLRGQISP